MRVLSHCLLLSVFALCIPAAVQAEDFSTVPASVDQIDDDMLRGALLQYSPNYNHLSRQDQVRAYVNIYQSLHGSQPALTASDSALLSQPVYVVPSEPQTYYYENPYQYYHSSDPGFSFGISIGGDRWNRPGWNRPGSSHRPPPHFGPGGPGRPSEPGRPGGHGRPGGPGGHNRPRPR